MDFLDELLLSQDATARKEKVKLPGGALTLDQRRKRDLAERQRKEAAERRKRDEERAKAEAEQAERGILPLPTPPHLLICTIDPLISERKRAQTASIVPMPTGAQGATVILC